MRSTLLLPITLALALSASACAKKSKATAPAAPAPASEAAPGGGTADDKAAESMDENGPKKPGDPCDGGEAK